MYCSLFQYLDNNNNYYFYHLNVENNFFIIDVKFNRVLACDQLYDICETVGH